MSDRHRACVTATCLFFLQNVQCLISVYSMLPYATCCTENRNWIYAKCLTSWCPALYYFIKLKIKHFLCFMARETESKLHVWSFKMIPSTRISISLRVWSMSIVHQISFFLDVTFFLTKDKVFVVPCGHPSLKLSDHPITIFISTFLSAYLRSTHET